MDKIENYINGKFISPSEGQYLENINPATGKCYSMVANSSAIDVNFAIEAAHHAFESWSSTDIQTRIEKLETLATLIESNLEELALIESIDNGKPLMVAKSLDIPRSAYNFRFFAQVLSQFKSEAYQKSPNEINYTLYQPLGVVTCISPWNLPLYLLTWKLAPALAMGNTIVAKPSEITPMSANFFAKLCDQAKIPAGVINIIHGEGSRVGTTLTTHPNIKAISFTGSTKTGKIINAQAASYLKKVSLEMGGKNPTIIFDDSDIKAAVQGAIKAAFSNQGQICLCGSRIFIQSSIYEEFKKMMVEETKKLQVGNPLEPKTQLGAIVSKEHFEKIEAHIEIAKEEGGVLLCGGTPLKLPPPNENGYFIPPTLFEKLSADCITNQEEIFGPVATLIPFDTEEEVLKLANNSRYGLACSVWTQNLNRAQRVSQKVQAGVVWVNTWMNRDLRTPFGGVKESGVGREGGEFGLRFFSEPKNICIEF